MTISTGGSAWGSPVREVGARQNEACSYVAAGSDAADGDGAEVAAVDGDGTAGEGDPVGDKDSASAEDVADDEGTVDGGSAEEDSVALSMTATATSRPSMYFSIRASSP